MKIKLMTLALMFCMTQSVAQGQDQGGAAASAPVTVSPNRSIATARGQGPATVWRNGSQSELSKAMQLLKDAESDEDREKAIDQLRVALDEQYDKSLENYSDYLDKLEEKVKTLREQVTKRRSAKDELVELKLKMMINEADGLGWPDNRASRFFMNQGGLIPNSQSGNMYFPTPATSLNQLTPTPTYTVPRVSGQSNR